MRKGSGRMSLVYIVFPHFTRGCLSAALVHMKRDRALANGAKLIWMVVLVVIPILGPIAYYLFGRSQLSRSFRVMFVVDAPLLYLAVTGLLVWIASL